MVNKTNLNNNREVLIKESNAKVISSSSGLIVFVVKNESELSFLNCGRLIENIWLRATKLNLSCYLVTGILFLYQRGEDKEIFNDKEINLIQESCQKIKELTETKEGLIIGFPRIGKAESPSAFSYKKPPETKWEE